MNNPRDEQFAGWAKAVVDKLYGLSKPAFPSMLTPEEAQLVLARAGYDLMCHGVQWNMLAHGDMSKIPDLVEEPKPQSKVDYIKREIPAGVLNKIDKPLDDLVEWSIHCLDERLGIWRYILAFKDGSKYQVDQAG